MITENKILDILRFTTVGSVDDGKSTLIGRLLYDSKNIFEDQLAAVKKTSSKKGFDGIDLSLLTDGLAAEREQGITIDVAYRYFSSPQRKFIIADTPGHEQYTRNMVTGASTANLTIILLDARKGIVDQTRRHLLISALLGIKYFVVAINKMDLIDYSKSLFDKLVADLKLLVEKLNLNLGNFYFLPISALHGDNIVNRSSNMPWYSGKTILDILETVEVQDDLQHKDFRFPVQYVIRVDNQEFKDFRAFAGQVTSGIIRVKDSVKSLPSGQIAQVKSILNFDKEQDYAIAKESVMIVLDREIDTSRGDMFVLEKREAQLSSCFRAYLCCMNVNFDLNKKYLLKHCSSTTKSIVNQVEYKLDINSYEKIPANQINLNDIVFVTIKTLKPIPVDLYESNQSTGSFILIDELNNNTVAAGMIMEIN